MPKSKEFISSSEESGSDSEVERKKAKKRKLEKKNKEVERKKEEEKKSEKKGASSKSGDENMFQLAKMRYATVSEFRGKVLVSIREYYEVDGDMRPGKKGISLSLEQWTALKDHMKDIDAAVKNIS